MNGIFNYILVFIELHPKIILIIIVIILLALIILVIRGNKTRNLIEFKEEKKTYLTSIHFETEEKLLSLLYEIELSEIEDVNKHLSSKHFETEEKLMLLQCEIELSEIEDINKHLSSKHFETEEKLILLQCEIEQSELKDINKHLSAKYFETEEQLMLLKSKIEKSKFGEIYEYLSSEYFETYEQLISLKHKIEHSENELLPKPQLESKTVVIGNKFVNYISNIQENETSYPIIKIPKNNCIVRTHRIGSTKRRGFKEESFQKAIEYYFQDKFQVSGNIRLNTGKHTRPFEPDIAIIDTSNKNIRIDIEIDEPYAGITRQPTHCKWEDVNRDNYFKERGWVVIRFSEHQIHFQEKKCLKFIASFISSIDNSFQVPLELQSNTNPTNQDLWDIVKAQKWEKQKFREEYLNHSFLETKELTETIKRDFNSQEIEEEKLVEPTSFGIADKGKNISFNRINSHKRDERIIFYSEPHTYTIDGVPASSASTLISRFFPEFDTVYWSERKANQLGMTPTEVANMWSEKGETSRNKGTFLHEQIENYFLDENYIETEEFDQFKDFINNHSAIQPYRSEWRIFDENHNIAGTIDLLVKNSETKYDIYDWKRSKKVVNKFDGSPITSNQWQRGIGKLSNIDDTSYNRYSLQQSLYRYIIEENYGIKIDNMYLIVLYPENDKYYKLSVPYLKNEIEYILKTI
jgi:very-short-patch-repair endonuclease